MRKPMVTSRLKIQNKVSCHEFFQREFMTVVYLVGFAQKSKAEIKSRWVQGSFKYKWFVSSEKSCKNLT